MTPTERLIDLARDLANARRGYVDCQRVVNRAGSQMVAMAERVEVALRERPALLFAAMVEGWSVVKLRMALEQLQAR